MLKQDEYCSGYNRRQKQNAMMKTLHVINKARLFSAEAGKPTNTINDGIQIGLYVPFCCIVRKNPFGRKTGA